MSLRGGQGWGPGPDEVEPPLDVDHQGGEEALEVDLGQTPVAGPPHPVVADKLSDLRFNHPPPLHRLCERLRLHGVPQPLDRPMVTVEGHRTEGLDSATLLRDEILIWLLRVLV